MRLQFRLLKYEQLNCSTCGRVMEYGDYVYIVPDKDVVLFTCELCHKNTLEAERLGAIGGYRRIARCI